MIVFRQVEAPDGTQLLRPLYVEKVLYCVYIRIEIILFPVQGS
jgi:hypothetical protein